MTLRLDKERHRYFFSPQDDLPKRIQWKIGGKWSKREVTARHMVTRLLPDGQKEKVQSGWRHQACRANFVLLPFGLFLRLEPTWMLTKADGKTPRGGSRVGPILSHCGNLEFGILADQIDYDELMRSEMEDDMEMPQLGFAFNEFVTIEEDATDPQH